MAMPRPHRVVPFPRKNAEGISVGEVAIRVLLQEECLAAKAASERYVRRILREQEAKGPTRGESGQGYADLADLRDAMEILFRACRNTDDLEKGFFPTVDAVGKHLTTDEIAVLVLNYRRVQIELGPIQSEMSTEEMDAWIDVLARGGSAYPFDSLSSGAQSQLMRFMACRLAGSPMDSSSPGSQLDAHT